MLGRERAHTKALRHEKTWRGSGMTGDIGTKAKGMLLGWEGGS